MVEISDLNLEVNLISFKNENADVCNEIPKHLHLVSLKFKLVLCPK